MLEHVPYTIALEKTASVGKHIRIETTKID